MNILYVGNINVPREKVASNVQIMNTCHAFAAHGHRVELLVTARRGFLQDDPFEYYGVEKNFTVRKIFTLWDIVPAKMVKRKGRIARIRCLIQMFSVRVYTLFKKYDVLYTRQPLLGVFFKNFVLELHTLPKDIHPINKMLWKRAERIVTITHALKRRLVRCGIPAEKIIVAPDGVDVSSFDISLTMSAARRQLSLPPVSDAKIAVFTGYITAKEGASRNINIFTQAASQMPTDVHLYIVGAPHSAYNTLAERTAHVPNLTVIPHRPHEEIPVWLKAANVLVLYNPAASLTRREYTSPMKLFEYMASERPIVATDVPALREVLNENNAFFVKPDDPDALAAGIQQVAHDTEQAQSHARCARSDVDAYTWQRRAEIILTFIRSGERA